MGADDSFFNRRMRKGREPITISHIVLLEARNVFGRVSGQRHPEEWNDLLSDLHGSVLLEPMDWAALREETHGVLERFSHKASIGTFDATIVASARLASASQFLSFDEEIMAIASCLGFDVFPELGAEGKAKIKGLRG